MMTLVGKVADADLP